MKTLTHKDAIFALCDIPVLPFWRFGAFHHPSKCHGSKNLPDNHRIPLCCIYFNANCSYFNTEHESEKGKQVQPFQISQTVLSFLKLSLHTCLYQSMSLKGGNKSYETLLLGPFSHVVTNVIFLNHCCCSATLFLSKCNWNQLLII